MSLRERLIELAHVIDRKVSWHRLPLPLSLPLLALMRDRLREENLYDTGQPSGLKPPETNGSSEPSYLTSRTWDGTFNDLDDPADGQHRLAFRPQRPARAHVLRAGAAVLDAERAQGQPRPDDARRADPGDDAEHPRCRLDPVRGPRLVQPRPERPERAVRRQPRRRRRLAGEPDGHPAHAAGRDVRSERGPDLVHR